MPAWLMDRNRLTKSFVVHTGQQGDSIAVAILYIHSQTAAISNHSDQTLRSWADSLPVAVQRLFAEFQDDVPIPSGIDYDTALAQISLKTNLASMGLLHVTDRIDCAALTDATRDQVHTHLGIAASVCSVETLIPILVRMLHHAMHFFDILHLQPDSVTLLPVDTGMICHHTIAALEQFYFDFGPFGPDMCFDAGSTTVTSCAMQWPWTHASMFTIVLTMLVTARTKLTALGYAPAKGVALSDPNSLRKQIKYFQRTLGLPQTMVLDERTRSRMASAGAARRTAGGVVSELGGAMMSSLRSKIGDFTGLHSWGRDGYDKHRHGDDDDPSSSGEIGNSHGGNSHNDPHQTGGKSVGRRDAAATLYVNADLNANSSSADLGDASLLSGTSPLISSTTASAVMVNSTLLEYVKLVLADKGVASMTEIKTTAASIATTAMPDLLVANGAAPRMSRSANGSQLSINNSSHSHLGPSPNLAPDQKTPLLQMDGVMDDGTSGNQGSKTRVHHHSPSLGVSASGSSSGAAAGSVSPILTMPSGSISFGNHIGSTQSTAMPTLIQSYGGLSPLDSPRRHTHAVLQYIPNTTRGHVSSSTLAVAPSSRATHSGGGSNSSGHNSMADDTVTSGLNSFSDGLPGRSYSPPTAMNAFGLTGIEGSGAGGFRGGSPYLADQGLSESIDFHSKSSSIGMGTHLYQATHLEGTDTGLRHGQRSQREIHTMPISATNSYQGQKRPVNGNSGGHGTSLRGIDRTESTVSDKSAISDMAADYTDTEGYFAMEEEDTPNGGRGVELMRHDSVGRGGGGRHVPLRGRRHEQSRRMMDIESNNDCDSSLLASFDPYLPRRSSSVPLPSVARSRDMQYTLHGSQYGAQLFCKRCNSRNDGSGESSECFASPNGSTHSFVQRRASFSDIGPLNRARLLHPDAEMNQYTAHAHRSATRSPPKSAKTHFGSGPAS
ncbi:hypothetical protein BSLG_010093 [Batrachochytrium salamandrivorans]|nr:hypothetical protein BSLG_010093 [Batrachochytrium salamandrivorans]